MNAQIVIPVCAILAVSLCASSSRAQPVRESSYKIETISSEKKDHISPTGSWKTEIEYPVLSEANAALKKINADIHHVVNEFKCDDDNGNKQFKAEVTSLTNKIVSMKFSDTWYCAGMPHSEGRTGAITYDLKTGSKVELQNELAPSEKETLMQKIASGLKQALTEKQVSEECPPPKMVYFYFKGERIVFANLAEDLDTLQCEVEYELTFSEMKKYPKADSILK